MYSVNQFTQSVSIKRDNRTRSNGIKYPSNSQVIKSSRRRLRLPVSCGFGRDDPGIASQVISFIAIPCTRACKEEFSCCFAVMNWRTSVISKVKQRNVRLRKDCRFFSPPNKVGPTIFFKHEVAKRQTCHSATLTSMRAPDVPDYESIRSVLLHHYWDHEQRGPKLASYSHTFDA